MVSFYFYFHIDYAVFILNFTRHLVSHFSCTPIPIHEGGSLLSERKESTDFSYQFLLFLNSCLQSAVPQTLRCATTEKKYGDTSFTLLFRKSTKKINTEK